MKILKTIRLILTAIMIGASCIFPVTYKDDTPKDLVEQRDIKEDDKDD
jgi:hypothetical protein